MNSVTLIRTQRDFDALEPVWQELLKNDRHHTIFQTFAWQSTWWNNLGGEATLYVLLVMDRDRPIGIAPLMQSPGSHRTIQFIGTPNADYSDVIGCEKERTIDAVVNFLNAHGDDWDVIELSQIPDTSPSLVCLRELLDKQRLPHLIRTTEKCMAYVYDGEDADRAEFKLKRNKTLRNYINFYEKTGGMTLECLRDADRIAAWLPKLFHSHINRWESTTIDSKFCQVEHRQFYRQLVQIQPVKDWLDLMVLKHGGQSLAYLLAYRYRGKIHLYTISNEPFYQRKSPGIVILHLIVEQYVREGFTEIDFARGAGTHKDRFITSAVQNYEALVFRRPAKLRAVRRREKIKSSAPLAKLLQSPFMEMLKSQISRVGVFGYFRSQLRRLGRIMVDYNTVICYAINETSSIDGTSADDLHIKATDESTMEEIAAFCGFVCDSPEHQEMLARFDAGDEVFVGHIDGVMAALILVHTGEGTETTGCDFRIGEGEVFLDGLLVSPVFERSELPAEFLGRVVNILHERGQRVVMSCDNRDLKLKKVIGEVGLVGRDARRKLRLLGIRIM